MKTAYENLEDMKRMQEEAFKRVQEMQKRAKHSLECSQPYSAKKNASVSAARQPISPKSDTNLSSVEKKVQECEQKSEPQNDSNENLLALIMQNSEKSMLMVLLMLLVEEKSDASLILALMYLIV